MMSDAELLCDAIAHTGEKRHSRIKGYYVCGLGCSNQFIFNRPLQTRQCPVCGRTIKLLVKVDEFEINRIKNWSNGTVIVEDEVKEERRTA